MKNGQSVNKENKELKLHKETIQNKPCLLGHGCLATIEAKTVIMKDWISFICEDV